MTSFKKGGIYILSSPSGAGKTTLVKKISKNKNFSVSISHTTRLPRPNEKNGEDYFFTSKNNFKKLIKKGEFLEHAKVFNNYYGSSKKNIINKLKKGKNVIFDIDWQGTEQIIERKLNYKLITIFILPPSKQVLRERLSNRDMKDKLIVDERMKQFERDVLHWINYDYVVINDDIERCFDKINNLIEAEINSGSKDYDINYIRDHVEKLTN